MNTKSSEISSGLPKHIAEFKVALNGAKGDLDAWLECNDESEVRQAIFGVISDAEVIISNLSRNDRYGVCDECGTPYSFDPTDGGTICVKCQKDKIAQKDAEILEQCRINGMGSEREAALLGKAERHSAALKLAKAAITEAKGWNWLDDDMSHVVQRQVDEALAAINEVLKGE